MTGGYPFSVCEDSDEVLAYAYGHAYRPRKAYERSVEVSVYVRNGLSGKGIGRALYGELLSKIEASGFHALMAGISLPNEASVRLHESFGFEKVAHFREVGFKFGRWIDVGYWEKLCS